MLNNKHIAVKSLLLASALACMSASAHADDSSMSRFGGDSYAYFNQPTATSSTPWRQAHPQGLSERALETDSSEGLASAWQSDRPIFATTSSDPSFRRTHPDGLTERELQALSSEASAWQLPRGSAASKIASTDDGQVAQGAPREGVTARLAAIFHRTGNGESSMTE